MLLRGYGWPASGDFASRLRGALDITDACNTLVISHIRDTHAPFVPPLHPLPQFPARSSTSSAQLHQRRLRTRRKSAVTVLPQGGEGGLRYLIEDPTPFMLWDPTGPNSATPLAYLKPVSYQAAHDSAVYTRHLGRSSCPSTTYPEPMCV